MSNYQNKSIIKNFIISIVMIILSLILIDEVLGVISGTTTQNVNENSFNGTSLVCVQEGVTFIKGNYNVTTYANPTYGEVRTALGLINDSQVDEIAYINQYGGTSGSNWKVRDIQQAIWYVTGESRNFGGTYSYTNSEGKKFNVPFHTWRQNPDDNEKFDFYYTEYNGSINETNGKTKNRIDINSSNYSGFDLYLNAREYASNNNDHTVTVNPEDPECKLSSDKNNVIVGPLNIYSDVDISSLTLSVGEDEETATTIGNEKYIYCNATEQVVTLPPMSLADSPNNFYIYFTKTYYDTIKGKKLFFNVNNSNIIRITEMKVYNNTGTNQRLAKFKTELRTLNITDSITLPTLTETPETPTKEQVSIKVKKIWDHQGYTGTKPTQIKINIYRNGILYSQETVDTGSSNTDYIKIEKPFDKCDANDNEYTYTIDEEVITGTNYTYAPESITGGKTTDGYEFTITNKYSPPKPTFEKENTDSLPPIKIQINKVLERNR